MRTENMRKESMRRQAPNLVVILHIVFYALLLSGLLGSLGGCVSVSSQKISPTEVAKANVNLAAEYFRLGRLEPALVAAKKAVAADDESVSANLMLALIYQSLEQAPLAEEYFVGAIEQVSEETSEYGTVHNNYAVFLCQNNRLPDAEQHFLLAAENKLYDTPQGAYENAGICALKAGKLKKAAVYFQKALTLSPNMQRSLFELAKIQYNAEKYVSASAYFQRYHEMSSGSAETLFMAMTAEQKNGSPEQALRIKNELTKRFPDSQEVGRIKAQ